GKLDRILDEEHRDIVANEIPISLLGVELDSETADVPGEIERSLGAGDRREAYKGFGLLPNALEQIGAGHVRKAVGEFEIAVRTIAAGMNHALGNALVIEMEDLFAKVEVFEK